MLGNPWQRPAFTPLTERPGDDGGPGPEHLNRRPYVLAVETPARGPQYYGGPPEAFSSRPDDRGQGRERQNDAIAPEAPRPALSPRLNRLALAQRQHHQGWR